MARSSDCGKTWAINKPSQTYPINNFTWLAIDPKASKDNGIDTVYVAWRQFRAKQTTSQFLIAKSVDGGKSWRKPVVVASFASDDDLFIQPQSPAVCFRCFRENPAPSITVDENGVVYYAFSMRIGPKGTAAGSLRDSRIVIAASPDGETWPPVTGPSNFPGTTTPLTPGTSVPTSSKLADSPFPSTATNPDGRGHQVMPLIEYNAGFLWAAWVDSRNTHTKLVYTRDALGQYGESREVLGNANRLADDPAQVFNNFIADDYVDSGGLSQVNRWRHTLDMYLAYAAPANCSSSPCSLGPFQSVIASKYRTAVRTLGLAPGQSPRLEQAEFNASALTHGGGKRWFIGDYNAFAFQRIVPIPGGGWRNSNSTDNPFGLLVSGDNRSVRTPADGNWENFTPAGYAAGAPITTPYPDQVRQQCVDDLIGRTRTLVRNQDPFSVRFSQGLIVEFLTNFKQLGGTKRALALSVQNTTPVCRSFKLKLDPLVKASGETGSASFLQSPAPVLDEINVTVSARSAIGRAVYLDSSDKYASVKVNVTEISSSLIPNSGCGTPGLPPVFPPVFPPVIGLRASAVANPDKTNPDVLDLSGSPLGAETYDPNVDNSPNISDPTPTDLALTSGIYNPAVADQDTRPGTDPFETDPFETDPFETDPFETDPFETDPFETDPFETTPDFSTGTARDATWSTSTDGVNTSAPEGAKLWLKDNLAKCSIHCRGNTGPQACAQDCVKARLILRRVTKSLVARGCALGVLPQNVVVSSIRRPTLQTDPGNLDVNVQDGTSRNTTLGLTLGGDGDRITLRTVAPNPSNSNPSQNRANPDPLGIKKKVKSVVGAQSKGQGQAVPPLTLTSITTNVDNNPFNNKPLNAVVGPLVSAPYSTELMAKGGKTSPSCSHTWSITGLLPPNLALTNNLTTGVGLISGTIQANQFGPFPFIVTVQDCASPSPHIADQDLGIPVNLVNIDSVSAYEEGFPGVTALNNGDFATIDVTIRNRGPITLNVKTTNFTVTPTKTASAGSCSLMSGVPALKPDMSADIPGTTPSNTQLFRYRCGPVSPSGTLTFTVSADVTGFYVTDTKTSNAITTP